MLSSLNCNQSAQPSERIEVDKRYLRSEKDDFKIAIDYLYEFKSKLNELNPQVLYIIEKLLQTNNRF